MSLVTYFVFKFDRNYTFIFMNLVMLSIAFKQVIKKLFLNKNNSKIT